MKAFAIDRYKSKDGGRIVDAPQPPVGDDDVLVQVHAAGVNLLDAKIADGEFKLLLPYRFPLTLGNDVAGVVVEVGARVRRFKPGDEVYARPDKDRIGTFAEFIAMNEADVAIKPAALSMEEAASIPLVGLTAWQALVEKADLKPGQKVFIQSGTGGVGRLRQRQPGLLQRPRRHVSGVGVGQRTGSAGTGRTVGRPVPSHQHARPGVDRGHHRTGARRRQRIHPGL
jgi:NADPH:quinone reductase-like Zn-dependent oxidoreductase